MSEVKISINGKSYGIECDNGQEDRVRYLANYIDERAKEIAGGSVALSDSYKMVLTCLVLADEIFDLREHCEALVQSQNRPHTERVSAQEEELIVRAIESLRVKVDGMATTGTQTQYATSSTG